jgi:hypothetical protein
MAVRMHAQCTILTHFSQRYPKAVEVEVEDASSMPPVCTAFDGMRVSSSMFPHIPSLLKATQGALVDPEQDETQA